MLLVEEIDIAPHPKVHWIMWNIPITLQLKEDHVPGKQGINDFGIFHCYDPTCNTINMYLRYMH